MHNALYPIWRLCDTTTLKLDYLIRLLCAKPVSLYIQPYVGVRGRYEKQIVAWRNQYLDIRDFKLSFSSNKKNLALSYDVLKN